MPLEVCELKDGKPLGWMVPTAYETIEEWKKRLGMWGSLVRAPEKDFDGALTFKLTSSQYGEKYYAVREIQLPAPN